METKGIGWRVRGTDSWSVVHEDGCYEPNMLQSSDVDVMQFDTFRENFQPESESQRAAGACEIAQRMPMPVMIHPSCGEIPLTDRFVGGVSALVRTSSVACNDTRNRHANSHRVAFRSIAHGLRPNNHFLVQNACPGSGVER